MPNQISTPSGSPRPTPCHLLALPAELRLQIYTSVLAPTGTLYLHRTPTKRHAITPSITPALLATNRQIHAEATGVLYTENTVHIAIDAHDTAWPAINEARLPLRVLGKLEHLCVLLDCTAVFWGRYAGVDFEAFTALEALRTLRVRVLALEDRVEEEDEEDGDDDQKSGQGPVEATWKFKKFPLLVVEILERVPVATRIFYGLEARKGEGDAAKVDVVGPLAPFDQNYTPKHQTTTLPGTSHRAEAREVSAEDLREGLEGIEDLEGRRGCKAGTVKDPWSGYRELKSHH
jgi:hypothetical protein